ncbi:antibiotic biosynthesis monooxygenase [Acidaminobacter sp. JC074]|uniref:antibiotic biosynthesis monooxygenase family protein n=1 Tax=Acidaminobacter sp. JC074 TaxID=2530199 RepID=UPI001F114510|nr:antibiotic biosynthesis monooxygenase [Acidaminobacter sp. JC074]MCH4888131.1 antibiotic biosynthesis monooxygenase [Acidaminobacter sp. JC074]
MITVLFEVVTKEGCFEDYLETAAGLKPELNKYTGLLHGERFESLTQDDKLLSLSRWESEEALVKWRNDSKHRIAQDKGMHQVFETYTITVADDRVHEDQKVVLVRTEEYTKLMNHLKGLDLNITYDAYKSLTDSSMLCLIHALSHVSDDLIASIKPFRVNIDDYYVIRKYTIDQREHAPRDSNKYLL